LIESYIADHGTDPVNGEELATDDLIELKNARAVHPRPPTLTSIPALLSTFQNEWDALALESFNLKQELAKTRQELSTALYDFEGALRVIAKISKERDEARDALSKVSVQGGGATSNGDAMQVDNQGLPEDIVAKVEATQQK
jgi:pre-mRNA-processing factor 19